MKAGPGRPRNQAKQEAVLACAIEAFAKDGYQKTDVHAIAASARVSYGTVYRYYASKEELLWSATYVVLERLGVHLRKSIAGATSAVAALRAAARAYAGFFQAQPECLGMFVESRAAFHGRIPESHRDFHDEMVQLFAQIVERGIAEGEICPIDSRAAVISLGCTLYGVILFACYVENQWTIGQLADRAISIFLDGIAVRNASSANSEG